MTWQAQGLCQLAHNVHQHNVWVWAGHCFPFDCGNMANMMLTSLEVCGDQPRPERSFGVVSASDAGPQITIFALVPITAEENLVRRAGADQVYPLVGDTSRDPVKHPVSFYLDAYRECAFARREAT
eukprot:TRINITY_DN40347_c0_g1_i1.p2 TRINITY_DN40347_c0_g1~~TRINITY_DN40347_c0_g1_i1.p2  ORF type:complete len:126 (+),score=25.45 TRINITY_DN40347_c0_g1_i1:265-642(+)